MSKKIALGRPTKYSEEEIELACEKMLSLFKDGLSQIEVATELGLTYDSYLLYQKRYPIFHESVVKGVQLLQCWYIRKGRENLGNSKFNACVYAKQMASMFRNKIPALKKAPTFTDKINVILTALSEGEVTAIEARQMSETISIGAKVEEMTELKQRIEELETLLPHREET
jgi:hypothetical protein